MTKEEFIKEQPDYGECLPGEIWKEIPGYPDYEASNKGRIRSKNMLVKRSKQGNFYKKGRLLKPRDNTYGYLVIALNRQINKVHQLIAKTFIPNINNYPYINHKDGNKVNNCVENLEWCTARYNAIHAIQNGLNNVRKPVLQYDLDNNFIKEYPSMLDVQRKTGITTGNISTVCNGNRNTAGGYKWKFKKQTIR